MYVIHNNIFSKLSIHAGKALLHYTAVKLSNSFDLLHNFQIKNTEIGTSLTIRLSPALTGHSIIGKEMQF